MNRQDVFKEVKKELQDWGVPESKIKETADLRNDLALGSLDQMLLLAQFEETYGVRVADELLEQMVTLEDIVTALYKTIAAQV